MDEEEKSVDNVKAMKTVFSSCRKKDGETAIHHQMQRRFLQRNVRKHGKPYAN